jgi:hypothetical protein
MLRLDRDRGKHQVISMFNPANPWVFRIQSAAYPTKVVDLASGSGGEGTPLLAWEINSSQNQKWFFYPLSR